MLCGSGSRVPARPQPVNVERALDNDLREQRQKQSDQVSNSQQLNGTYHDQTASSWTKPITIKQRQRSRHRSPTTLCGSGPRVPARPQPENVEQALDNDLRE